MVVMVTMNPLLVIIQIMIFIENTVIFPALVLVTDVIHACEFIYLCLWVCVSIIFIIWFITRVKVELCTSSYKSETVWSFPPYQIILILPLINFDFVVVVAAVVDEDFKVDVVMVVVWWCFLGLMVNWYALVNPRRKLRSVNVLCCCAMWMVFFTFFWRSVGIYLLTDISISTGCKKIVYYLILSWEK